MKALSIKQPWASLIAHGIKDIENRTWRTHFRGKIYIHASSISKGMLGLLNKNQVEDIRNKSELDFDFAISAIIGEVDIIDCVINHESIWAEKSYPELHDDEGNPIYDKPTYNWVLTNPILYDKPIQNVKGKLSLWEWNGCDQICESCENNFNIQFMQLDYDSNWFCKECAEELFPIIQKEYDEMVANGELEPD